MIVMDSCIWVALFSEKDSCHQKAYKIIENTFIEDVIINEHIYAETLNVLRNKTSDKECSDFINLLRSHKIDLEPMEKEITTLANFIFFHNQKISFTDSIIIAHAASTDSDFATFDFNLQKAWKKLKK